MGGEITINRIYSVTDGVTDPVPIVLWAENDVAAVLSFSQTTDDDNGTISQQIDKITIKAKGLPVKAKKYFNDFPITIKGQVTDENSFKRLDIIDPENILVGDINGDNVDELIFVRRISGVYVYTAKKLLYLYKSIFVKTQTYKYVISDIHKVCLKNRDVVFLVINRRPHDSVAALSPDELSYHKDAQHSFIIMVSKDGISSIPLEQVNQDISEVLAVGAVNFPGSDEINEIVVCYKKKDSKDTFLSRHKIDGSIIDSPRKLYIDIHPTARMNFKFVPQSSQLFVYEGFKHQVYFITPEKKANWIRVVDLEKLLGDDENIHFLNIMKVESKQLALVRNINNLYLLDEESAFYHWRNGALAAQKNKIPYLIFKQESASHRITNIISADNYQILVVQSRKSQPKNLATEVLVDSAEKFLSDRRFARCKKKTVPKFGAYEKGEAEYLLKEKGIHQEITSMDDIKKHLPEFYDSQVKYAERRFLSCLKIRLFRAVENDNYFIEDISDDIDYKHQDDYIKWLRTIYIHGELLFTAINLKGELLAEKRINEYYPPEIESGLNIPPVQYKAVDHRGIVIMTLQKKSLTEGASPSCYLIKW